MTVQFPPNTSIERNALAVLAAVPLFEDIEPAALVAISEKLEWFCIRSGTILFAEGDKADSLYVVTSGCLGAYRNDSQNSPQLIGRIQYGETVGEGAILAEGTRTATVVSMRDTELIRFSKEAFDSLVQQYPTAMVNIARLTFVRLEQSLRREEPRASSRSFAIVGNGATVDAKGFARALVESLSRLGRTELFSRDSVDGHTSAWFNEVESRREFVVFVADDTPTPWTRQCIAQADTLVLLVDARDETRCLENFLIVGSDGSAAQRTELVLQHKRFARPGAARRWLAQCPAKQHHHVKSKQDIDRLARLLTGNAVGLVLSGGGARGFAHIGVIKALREADITIDLCGGTSIGSIMASGVAAGWDDEQMVERFRRTFVERNPIGDYTLPLISLSAGRRVSRLLRGEIGDIDIEDLALPFFCVSTDLANAGMVVHRTGPLWRCLRASVAIPGILPPVFDKQQILVDGGLINHLPVDVMRGFSRGRVIGVDVGSKAALAACNDVDELSVFARLRLLRGRRAPNILQLLLSAGSLSTKRAAATNAKQSSILLAPKLDGIDILDWRAFDRAIEAGYRSTIDRMEEILVAIEGQRKTVPPSALVRAGISRSSSSSSGLRRTPRGHEQPRVPDVWDRTKNWLTSLFGRPDSS
jgi:NTE family protein